jgi:hypothetical protein
MDILVDIWTVIKVKSLLKRTTESNRKLKIKSSYEELSRNLNSFSVLRRN